MFQIIGNRIIQAISHQTEKAIYFCDAENIASNQKIHELRRGFKRQRALLRFFKEIPYSPAVQLNKDIRNFGKLLAPLRESAVNMDLFDKVISSNKHLPEKKIKNARELLIQKNKLLIERGFLENNLDNTIRTFFDGFDEILTKSNSVFPGRIQFFHEVSQSYLKSISFYQQLPANPHAEDWHKLRKRLKRLWYQLDFVKFLHPRFIKLKSDQLNKITDQLGDDHDLHVFAEDLLAENYGFDDEELQILFNQIEYLRELNQLKLRPRLKQFFTATPEEFDQKMESFFKL